MTILGCPTPDWHRDAWKCTQSGRQSPSKTLQSGEGPYSATSLDSSKSRVASECNLKVQGESLVSLNSDMGPIVHK